MKPPKDSTRLSPQFVDDPMKCLEFADSYENFPYLAQLGVGSGQVGGEEGGGLVRRGSGTETRLTLLGKLPKATVNAYL